MKKEEALAIFMLAYFDVKAIYELPNEYWPEAYVVQRAESPWWLVSTEMGNIKIGWRKRVISINWEETGVECIVTDDDVTKGKFMVHAYSHAAAVKYLDALRREYKKQSYVPEHAERGWQPK